MNVALGEGNLNIVFVQSIVDDFLDAGCEGKFLLDEHPNAYLEVNAVVTKVSKGDADRDVSIRDGLTCCVLFLADWRDGFDEQLPYLLDIGSVSHTNGYLDEFVTVVPCHVLEVLAEKGTVEEGDDAAVVRKNLRTLIGDALHLSRNAVALDIVTHVDAPRHEADAIEEVLQNALHGETETSGETCTDDADAVLRHTEDDEYDDDVESPAKDSDDVACQCLVDGFVVVAVLLAVVEVETAQGIVDVAENKEEYRCHAHQ